MSASFFSPEIHQFNLMLARKYPKTWDAIKELPPSAALRACYPDLDVSNMSIGDVITLVWGKPPRQEAGGER